MGGYQFSTENEVFAAFLFYGALVVLKLVIMSPITIMHRILLNNFMNWEDTKPQFGEGDPEQRKRALVPNEHVNRVKRAHANDIENIVPFLILGFMYVAIKPEPAMAIWLFKMFAGARYAHTIIYLFHVRQPARFLAFLVGLAVNIFMAYQVIITLY